MSALLNFITKSFKVGVIGLFLLGLLACGTLATETRLLFFWPAALLIGASAVVLILAGKWKLPAAPSDLCLLTALLFGGYLVVRGLSSPVIAYAREDWYLVLGCAVTYTLAATVFSSPRLRMAAVVVLLLLTAGNLAVGFVHFSGKWTFHIVPDYIRSFGEARRIGGFFINSNHLAAFLAMMSLFFGAITMLGRIGGLLRITLGFISMFALLGVALTLSRGALIGLGVGGLTLGVIVLRLLSRTHPYLIKRLLVGVGAFALLAGVVFFGVFSEQLYTRFSGTAFNQGDSRLFVWRSAMPGLAAQPLIGAGARTFYDACITNRTPDSPPWMQDAQFVHNDWLQLLAEYGWLGLLLLLGVLFAHFRQASIFLKWYATERFPLTGVLTSRSLGMVAGAVAALVAVLVHALFDFHFHVPAIALTAAFLFGIIANPGLGRSESRPVRIPGVRPVLKWGTAVAGVCLVLGAIRLGQADYFAEKADQHPDDEELKLDRIVWLSRAIELDSKNFRTWYQRGLARIHAAAGEPQTLAKSLLTRAITDLETASRLNGDQVFVVLALADAYDAVGRQEDAMKSIQKAARLAPLFEGPRLALALHYHRLQNRELAEEAYLWAADATAGRLEEWRPYYKKLLEEAQR